MCCYFMLSLALRLFHKIVKFNLNREQNENWKKNEEKKNLVQKPSQFLENAYLLFPFFNEWPIRGGHLIDKDNFTLVNKLIYFIVDFKMTSYSIWLWFQPNQLLYSTNQYCTLFLYAASLFWWNLVIKFQFFTISNRECSLHSQ